MRLINRCPHVNLQGIYGDDIHRVGGYEIADSDGNATTTPEYVGWSRGVHGSKDPFGPIYPTRTAAANAELPDLLWKRDLKEKGKL